jgi:hypothetical protein
VDIQEEDQTTRLHANSEIRFTQLDITETFGDNLRLTEDDWVETSPLNERVPDPASKGLPPRGADDATTVCHSRANVTDPREHSHSRRRRVLPHMPYCQYVVGQAAHSLPEMRQTAAEVWVGLMKEPMMSHNPL